MLCMVYVMFRYICIHLCLYIYTHTQVYVYVCHMFTYIVQIYM